jgi:hypothetical protein
MSIDVKVYDNGDHTALVWLPADGKPIPDCRGFTIRRLKGGTESFLHGFVGFSDDDKLDPSAMWKHPVQRYMWWDYGVSPGDVVQYSVVPVVGPDKDHLTLAKDDASALTPEMTITGQATQNVSAYFNKGIVAAQWVSRALAILANGAFKPPTNDENKDVRAKLRVIVDLHDRLVTGAHFAHNKFVVFCDANGTPQRVLSGSTNWTMTGLCTQANNGIIVNDAGLAKDFLDEWNLLKDAGNNYPLTLAQANSQAKTFNVDGGRITQWFAPTSGAQDLDCARQLINAAKDGILFLFFNPGAFVADNLPEEKWTLLQNILFRHHQGTANFNPNLYIRGVVNQEIANLTTESAAAPSKHAALDPSSGTPVTLFSGGTQPPQHLGFESMVPKNIKDVFHNFMKESLGTGVHIHSKVVVIDPFGQNPVVMTGSHNLGFKASSENDDNLMIVEGNAPLAAAYAANIIATYQAYRWNAYVEAHRQDPKVWHGLVDNDTWQGSHLAGDELAEIRFWLGSRASLGSNPTMSTPASTSVPASGPARTVSVTGPAKPKRPPVFRKKAVAKKPVPPRKIAAARKKAPAKTRRTTTSKRKAAKKQR